MAMLRDTQVGLGEVGFDSCVWCWVPPEKSSERPVPDFLKLVVLFRPWQPERGITL